MPAHVVARRDEGGLWTLERDGTALVEPPGVSDDELVERIADLVVVGWLDGTDRISVVDVGHLPSIRRIEELLRLAGPAGREHDLARVRAERYASEEHYV